MKSLNLLNNLKLQLRNCATCSKMVQSRKEIMGDNHYPCFFKGTHNTKLMFIGIAPGRLKTLDSANPDSAFKHGSGKILRRIFNDFNINLDDIFVTNILKCNTPSDGKFEIKDVKNCVNNFLKKEIELVNPKKIILLGAKARTYFHRYVGITENVYTTWHPAAVMRGFKKYPDYVEQFKNILV